MVRWDFLLCGILSASLPMHAIDVQNLHKVYKGGKEALKSVSLTVGEGDFFALLGPNGAGKTTLIGILTGLVVKTRGDARIFGHSLDTDSGRAKTFIGLVPQEINFNIFEKVFDIVVNQGGYYGIPRTQAKERAHQLLEDLGLGDKKFEMAQKLSGGMKRRLMIARGLIHNPRLLILDEPTAGVDVELRRSMWEYLRRINAEGTTIVLTTHYLEEAEQLSKNIAIINKGEVVVNEPTAELIKRHGDKRLEDIFIELIGETKE